MSEPPSEGTASAGAPLASPQKKSLLRRLKPLLMLVAFAFVLHSAWSLGHRWQATQVSLAWPWVVASVVPLCIGCLLQGRGWISLIERMTSTPVPHGPALSLYLDSQLARYTPGMVGLPVVRMAGAPRLGVPAMAVGSSVGLEMLSWAAVGGAIGFASLLALPVRSGLTATLGVWAKPLVLAFSLAVLVLVFVDRTRLPPFVVRILKVSGTGSLVPPALPLAHVAYWLTWAVHGALMTHAFGAEFSVACASSGLYALATVGGFVALAAPAGVGVREAILSLSLAPVLGAAPAVAVAVASRAASLCADILVWAALKRWAR